MAPNMARSTLWAVILAYLGVAIYLSAANPTICSSDMFGQIQRAEGLSLSVTCNWVNGFYPFGYPLLLRLASSLSVDYVFAGRAISLVFGIVGLLAVWSLSRYLFSPWVALLATVFCVTNPSFMQMSISSGTDMPCASLLALGAYLLCLFAVTDRLGFLIGGGIAVGAAYLFRYNALSVIPAVVIWLLVRPGPSSLRKRARFQQILVLIGTFVLIASPQLVLSYLLQGNPFYNLHYKNVLFGALGSRNFGLNWHATSASAGSMLDMITLYHDEILRNWYKNFLVLHGSILPFPLGLLWLPGLLVALRPPRLAGPVALIALILIAYDSAVSLTFLNQRFYLYSSMLCAIFAASGAIFFTPRKIRLAFSSAVPLRVPLLVALCLWLFAHYTVPKLIEPLSVYDKSRIEVSKALARLGMRNSNEALTFWFDYYDMRKPTKDRLSISWYSPLSRPYKSIEDIAQRMRKAGQKFLVFDHRAPDTVPGLSRASWPFDKKLLSSRCWPFDEAELNKFFDLVASFPPSVKIYRLKKATKAAETSEHGASPPGRPARP